jgi:pyridoxal phosphate enzyme (YggS family)
MGNHRDDQIRRAFLLIRLTSFTLPNNSKSPYERDHMTSEAICRRLGTITADIQECERQNGRAGNSVALIAVSKKKPVERIREALACGQRRFGESYAQEFHEKAVALTGSDIEWHFIGPIQSNKTKLISAHADWVHSVDREKIARRLAKQRPDALAPLNICLQVNIDNEPEKSGVPLQELPALAHEVAAIDNIRLRGLMCIPRRRSDPDAQRAPFAQLREAMADLNNSGFALDTLSMGMSGDYAAAIAEGATMIRIGTAIFGQRS